MFATVAAAQESPDVFIRRNKLERAKTMRTFAPEIQFIQYTHTMEKKTKMPKATIEQAQSLEKLLAEIESLKGKQDAESEKRSMALYQEYYDLISQYDWIDEIFEDNGKKGLKNSMGEIVVPAIYDDFCFLESYYNKHYNAVAIKDGKAGLVKRDGTGTPVTGFEYLHMARIPLTSVYAVWKPEDTKHLALMLEEQIITPFEIEAYGDVSDGAIRLGANGKIGMLHYGNGITYVKPEYDDIHDEGVGEDFIFTKDGKEGRLTWEQRFVSDEEYNSLTADEQDALLEEGFICAPDF